MRDLSFAAAPGEVPQVRLVGLYDVLNQIMIGAELSQWEIGEGYLAECLLPRAEAGDLVLYDRGFPSFYLLALHASLGVDYCMRTQLGRFKAVADFVASGATEQWVAIAPCPKARRDCLRNVTCRFAPLSLIGRSDRTVLSVYNSPEQAKMSEAAPRRIRRSREQWQRLIHEQTDSTTVLKIKGFPCHVRNTDTRVNIPRQSRGL